MGTNAGHNSSSSDGAWITNPEESIDFGHRAMHQSIMYSKQVVSAYYGDAASWSYYMGCSTGGRQGFATVQLYPDDVDGALIGDPVIWQTHLEAWENYVSIGQFPHNLSSYISPAQWSNIHAEVLVQCDHLDGLVDGLVSNHHLCNFVPEMLLCTPSSNQTLCLNEHQLGALKKYYAGWTDANNTLVYPGIPVGSEEGGITAYTTGTTPGGFGADFYQYALLNVSKFVPMDITYADVQIADEINSYGGIADAFDPNLVPFHSRGGKILHYHGWEDSICNSGISELYYSKVHAHNAGLLAASGSNLSASWSGPVSNFYRLFMVPGMGYCQGGDGAWAIGTPNQLLPSMKNDSAHNALLALVEWTEGGKAPEKIVGVKYSNQTTLGTTDQPASLNITYARPSCMYPNAPIYLGGDSNHAENWACPKGLF